MDDSSQPPAQEATPQTENPPTTVPQTQNPPSSAPSKTKTSSGEGLAGLPFLSWQKLAIGMIGFTTLLVLVCLMIPWYFFVIPAGQFTSSDMVNCWADGTCRDQNNNQQNIAIFDSVITTVSGCTSNSSLYSIFNGSLALTIISLILLLALTIALILELFYPDFLAKTGGKMIRLVVGGVVIGLLVIVVILFSAGIDNFTYSCGGFGAPTYSFRIFKGFWYSGSSSINVNGLTLSFYSNYGPSAGWYFVLVSVFTGAFGLFSIFKS